MSSRRLVRQTLEFESPRRVPRQLWVLPWAEDHYPDQLQAIRQRFPDDILSSPSFLRSSLQTAGDQYAIGTYIDEWGCQFENRQAGVIGEVKEPRLKTWDDLEGLRFPTEVLSVDRDQVNAFCRQTDRYILAGCCPRPFERLQFLRKSENVYLDLGEGSQGLLELLHRLHEFYLIELELWATTEVDGLSFMDDWGAQRNLLISPSQWRSLFKPLYKDYIDLAHRHGKAAFMHSDGYIADILPDLVELGLDALNAQLFVMDIETLGRQFGGQITFWGEIDRQHLLPNGSLEEVAAAVRQVKEALFRQGGVIAQCEFGAGARPENVSHVFQTWEDLFLE